MSNPFAKATKKQAKLRMAIIGPSGSGKTFTAIKIANSLGKTAVIDSEHGSASKYADQFEFDTLELHNFDPRSYIEAINAAAANGYEAVVIDSLTHAWKDLLNQKNTMDAKGGNSYVNWGKITPKQDALIEAILAAPIHVIGTMRVKMDYVLEEQVIDGKKKQVPRKVGLAPVQRDDVEYEFDIVADMDLDNNMFVSKSRCSDLSGKMIERPGADVALILKNWLTDGAIVETPKTEEIRVVPPSEVVETPQNAVDPLLALKNANSEMDAKSEPATKFEFDLTKVVFEVGKSSNVSSQERFYTTKKLHEEENAFANVTSMEEAVKLVVARLNSPEHGKGKKEATA